MSRPFKRCQKIINHGQRLPGSHAGKPQDTESGDPPAAIGTRRGLLIISSEIILISPGQLGNEKDQVVLDPSPQLACQRPEGQTHRPGVSSEFGDHPNTVQGAGGPCSTSATRPIPHTRKPAVVQLEAQRLISPSVVNGSFSVNSCYLSTDLKISGTVLIPQEISTLLIFC